MEWYINLVMRIYVTYRDLNWNNIRYIPANAFEMLQLEELRITHNKLEGLPEGLFTSIPTAMTSLRVLNFESNKIKSFHGMYDNYGLRVF